MFIINPYIFSGATQTLADQIQAKLTSPSNLIALWTFDITSGTSIEDQSGNNHTLTLNTNANTLSPDGKKLTFGNSNYWSVSDTNDLSFGNGSTDNAFSLISYSIPVFNSAYHCFYGKYTSSNSEYGLYVPTNNSITLVVLDNSSGSYKGRTTGAQTTPSGATLYTATYSGNAQNSGIKIYKDTTQIDNSDYGGGSSYIAMENTAQDLTGYYYGNTSWTCAGDIYSNIIIKEELSLTQIGQIKTILEGHFV